VTAMTAGQLVRILKSPPMGGSGCNLWTRGKPNTQNDLVANYGPRYHPGMA
jgi:hypothetical protein